MKMTAPYAQTPAPGQPPYAQAPPYGAPQYPAGPLGKIRNPINVALLSIVTFGIYTLVYWFKTGNELKAHKNVGVGGAVYLILALVIGIVPPFLLGNDVKTLRAGAGQEPKVSAMTAFWLLIPLVGLFIYIPKVQGALNEYWVSQGAVQA
jgi:hypothetical protein